MEQSRIAADGQKDPSADLSKKMDGLSEGAQAKAGEATDQIKDKVGEFAQEQKAAGADQIAGLSRAVHGAAQELGKELPQAAGFIHSAADSLEGASSALRERSFEDLVGAFRSFAHKQPAAAFAGSVLAGFALSRFVKSSGPSGNNM